MGIIFVAVFAILNLSPYLQAQETSPTKSVLTYRIENPRDWYFTNHKPLLNYNRLVEQPDTLIAVRVCTKEPLAKAVVLSGSKPFMVANYMKLIYGYTPDRVLFLRSEECHRGKAAISSTEVWIIPRGAVPPDSNQSIEVQKAEKFFRHSRGRRSSRKVSSSRRI
jgi:hypothetical protein